MFPRWFRMMGALELSRLELKLMVSAGEEEEVKEELGKLDDEERGRIELVAV